MKIQNIKNETIHKLNRHEIGDLGLVNHGVMLYKGELKTRKPGLKRTVVNDWQINFEGTVAVLEFIKIEPTLTETEWAMRIRQKSIYPDMDDFYIEDINPLLGCDFFR